MDAPPAQQEQPATQQAPPAMQQEPSAASSYLDYLPAIFRQDSFAGQFLLAFETVLSGTGLSGTGLSGTGLSGTGGQPGLEITISRIADYFDPVTTEAEFLPWLAGWVTLSLRADWDEQTQRGFIQQIVPLYRLRGTRAGLLRMLTLYTGEPVDIYDDFGDPPHFFQVRLTLSEADPVLLQVKQQIARAIIDQEKPAHTFYALQIAVPTMRLVSEARHEREHAPLLILGQNTILGTSIPNL